LRFDCRPYKSALIATALALSLAFAGSATAQSQGDAGMRAIDNRLNRLEREISDLQRQSYGGGGAPAVAGQGGNTADLQSRVMGLEEQVRSLTGDLDEANHRAAQASRDLEAFKADVDLRFRDLQGGGVSGAAPGAPAASDSGRARPASSEGTLGTVPAGKAAASAVLPDGTPETQYEFAIELMKRGQYDRARNAFAEFLKLHPKHELAGNSQYWLGETYYAQNNYKQAGDAFLTGYTTYASSNKAPDSLLKLGMSLDALGNKDAACTVWGELGSKFPQASPSVVARAKLERQKAGC
tara:strand:+ start:1441 stop:2331 length:891 start_codon:yes stop_codon:yes gene_type:complete